MKLRWYLFVGPDVEHRRQTRSWCQDCCYLTQSVYYICQKGWGWRWRRERKLGDNILQILRKIGHTNETQNFLVGIVECLRLVVVAKIYLCVCMCVVCVSSVYVRVLFVFRVCKRVSGRLLYWQFISSLLLKKKLSVKHLSIISVVNMSSWS